MKRMRHPHRGKMPGFSLVELLAVISLIAILSALTVPVTRMAIAKGRGSQCLANLRSIGIAFNTYATEHSGLLPSVDGWRSSSPEFTFWAKLVTPYLSGSKDWEYYKVEVLKCPTIEGDRPVDKNAPSYTMNGELGDYSVGTDGTYLGRIGRPLTTVANPAKTVMVFCSMAAWTSTYRSEIFGKGVGAGYGTLYNGSSGSLFGEVHDGKAHVVYVDGHVEANSFEEINETELWTGSWP